MKVTISNTNLTRKSLISAAGTSLFLFSLVLGFFVANFASPVLAYEMPFCTVTVGYSVCTDQADYTPSSIVHIAGSGFSPSNLLVKVTRADGSVVTGDGSFAAWPTAYDTVVADSEGKFQFDYILDGIEGLYAIEVLDSGNNVLASHSFTDAKHTFSITIDSPTGGSVLNPVQASGNVSSINFPGQLTAYIVRIDWGDGSGLTDLNQSTNHLILTTSNGGKDFSGIYKTNTDLAHTYTPGATYTITALLCHQSCTGAEGADATASVTIAVPVTQGTLTVIKHVINNNGGTKQISDFPLFVGATPVTSGVQNTFDAGSYVVSETGQSDYAATISGDCDSDGNVVLNIGNVKSCTITNDDVDTTPPVITLLGSTPVTIEVHSTYTDAGATALDDYDGDLTSSIVTVNPVNTNLVGIYTVTYDVADSNGNSAVQVIRTVNVVDTTLPVITLVGANPQAIEVLNAYTELGATASDNYDGDLTGSIVIDASAVNTNLAGSYTVTYDVVDSNGNHAVQVTRTVNVVDTTRPIIASHADVTAEATSSSGAIVSYILPTATDNYDSSVSVICTPVSGSTFGLGENVVDCEATDAHSNKATSSFKITVVDTTSPTLNLPADITQEATSPSGAAVSYTATATDLVDGSITPTCLPASGSTFALGTTLVTCSATDAHGNIGSASFNVIVQDTTPPVITLTGANPQTIEVLNAYTELGATASDNFDGDISGSIVIDATNVNMNLVGTYTVTYDVADSNGNHAVQVIRTVNVVDTTPPIITVTGGDETIEIHTPYTDAGATALDNYDSSVTVTSTGTVDVDTLGDYTISYDAVDSNGNHAAQKSRTVHVVDRVAPTCSIAEPLKDSYLHGTASIKLSASDLGSGISKVEWSTDNSIWLPTTFDGTFYSAAWDTAGIPDGTYTIYGRATDNAGLVTYDPVNVVVDNKPPVITIVSPENITYSSNSVGLTFTVSEPTSSVVYSLDGATNVSATNTTLTGLADKSHTLTIYATDLAGNQNTATIVFTVSVPPAPEPPAQTVGGGIAPSASIDSSNILTNKPTAESQVIVQNGRATLWNPSIFVDSVCSEEIIPKSLNVLNPSQSASFAVNFDCKGVAYGEYPITYSLQLPSGRIIASKTYTLTISEAGVSVPNVVILSATSTTLTPGETGTISVTVQNSGDAGTNGNVSLNSENGFSISPLNIPISLQPGEQKSISFKITSSNNTGLPTGNEMLTGFASLIGINLPSTEKVDVLVDYETPDGINSVGKAIDVTINPRFPYFLIILFVSLAAGFYYFYFCRRKKKEEESK